MPDWISSVADAIGIVSAMLAAIYSIKTNIELKQEKQRQGESIKINLKYGGRTYPLPVELARAELSRAEVLGRLGMIPINDEKILTVKQPRFSIGHTNTEGFLLKLVEIKNSSGKAVLEIPCSREEFEQFKINE